MRSECGSQRVSARFVRDETAMSLVEVMIAIVLLGVILTSAAVSIIAFTQQASVSERRVLATATMTRLHESFQTIPFELTGLYQSDAAVLEGLGTDVPGFAGIDTVSPIPRFEDRPLVLLPDMTEPDPTVPRAYLDGSTAGFFDEDGELVEEPSELDLRRSEYRVVQVITEIDRSGDGVEDVRRLTTIVNWDWLGRSFTDRMDSERAATYFEAGDPSQARAFLTAPLRIPLGVDHELLTAVQLIATFTVPVDKAVVSFERAVDDGAGGLELAAEEVVLSAIPPVVSGGYTRFSGAIPTSFASEATRFLPEQTDDGVTLTLVGSTFGAPALEIHATAIAGLDPGGGQAVGITLAQASPATVGLTDLGLGCPIIIQATVDGMTPDDYSVTASWVAGLVRRTVALMPVGAESTILLTGQTFRATLSATDRHGFQDAQVVRFDIRAEGAGGEDAFLETNAISIVAGDGGCP